MQVGVNVQVGEGETFYMDPAEAAAAVMGALNLDPDKHVVFVTVQHPGASGQAGAMPAPPPPPEPE